MIPTNPWDEEQNNDPSFQADIWQVAMVSAFVIAILFMFLGNSIPLKGNSKAEPEVKRPIPIIKDTSLKPIPKTLVKTKKVKEPKKQLPDKTKKMKKAVILPPTQKQKIKNDPTKAFKKNDPIKADRTQKPDRKHQSQIEPFALIFKNNDALYYLMKRGTVRLYILIPKLKLQYQAIYKKKAEFDFKPEAKLSGFIYELTGTSVPPVLSRSFKTYSPGLAKKKLTYLIQVEKHLDQEFKKAFAVKKGRFVITKDGKVKLRAEGSLF